MRSTAPRVHSWPLALVLCTLFGLGATGSATAASDKEQLQNLKNSIEEIKNWLSGAKDQQSQQQKELKQAEVEIGQVHSKLRKVSQELTQSQNNLQRLNDKQNELTQAARQQQELLAQQMRAAYRIGKQEYAKILLNQERPDKVSRTLAYYGYFNRARRQQIDEYHATHKSLEETRGQIQTQSAQLSQIKAELETTRADLNQSKQKREQVLKQLRSSIQSKDQELAKLLADRQQLEALLNQVKKRSTPIVPPPNNTPFARRKGQLSWPVQGKVVRRFGSTDNLSKTVWNGILIETQEGSAVHAVHDGRVVFADWLRGFGLLMIIDHGNGYMSLYGHNQSLNGNAGDWVNANQVIASVGNSGGRNNSGLYFEIRHQGQPQNPQSWILASK